MKKAKAIKITALLMLAICAAAIFAAVLTLNALKEYRSVRYAEIMLVPACLAFALIRLKECGKDGILTCAALFCTLLADYVMIILETHYEISLLFFSAAQLFYCARIQYFRNSAKYTAISLAVRAALCAAAAATAASIIKEQPLTVGIAAFYFINLAANAAEAFAVCAKKPMLLTFAFGLLLFIGCDVCVGLNAASSFTDLIHLSEDGLYAVNILIWIFYMPSQALLTVSAQRSKKNETLFK